MDDVPQDEPKLFDLNRWIALEDERKQGLGILVPSTPDEMDIRRPLITKVSGAPPNAYRAIKAAFHIEMLMSQIENRMTSPPLGTLVKIANAQEKLDGANRFQGAS